MHNVLRSHKPNAERIFFESIKDMVENYLESPEMWGPTDKKGHVSNKLLLREDKRNDF